jgi:hypothetical protein
MGICLGSLLVAVQKAPPVLEELLRYVMLNEIHNFELESHEAQRDNSAKYFCL